MKQLLLPLFLVASIAAPAAFGSTLAITSFTNSSSAGHSNYDVAGYQFNTSSAIDITSLGMWVSGESLADSHNIGVYTLGGVLQFSGSVASGATGDTDGFTWVDLTGSHVLAAGDWFIGVQYNAGSADKMFDGSGSINMASGLTFLNAQVYYSGSAINFSDPSVGTGIFTEGLPRDSFIGPNFKFDAVPEPGTWVMLVGGLVAVTLRRRHV
jgi:hypothetical protein